MTPSERPPSPGRKQPRYWLLQVILELLVVILEFLAA